MPLQPSALDKAIKAIREGDEETQNTDQLIADIILREAREKTSSSGRPASNR